MLTCRSSGDVQTAGEGKEEKGEEEANEEIKEQAPTQPLPLTSYK